MANETCLAGAADDTIGDIPKVKEVICTTWQGMSLGVRGTEKWTHRRRRCERIYRWRVDLVCPCRFARNLLLYKGLDIFQGDKAGLTMERHVIQAER